MTGSDLYLFMSKGKGHIFFCCHNIYLFLHLLCPLHVFLDSPSVASCIRICFTDTQFGFVRPFSSTSTMPCPYLVDFSWYVQTAVLKLKTSKRCFNVFCRFFLRGLRTFHGVTTFGRRSGVWQLGLKKMCESEKRAAAMQLRYLYCFFITPAVSYRVAGIQALAEHLWNRFCVNSFLDRSTLPSICSCSEVSLDDIEHGFLRARPDYFEALTIGWCSLCDDAVPPHCHFSGYLENNQNILCMNSDLLTIFYIIGGYWWYMYGTVQ